jgi:DNA-binding MarR family transcriptional regulator
MNPAMRVISSRYMTDSYNHCVTTSANPRLDNLLASLTLNLAEEGQQALERASGLAGSAAAALLALEQFLGGAHVGRLADVLGLTHSGAVRLVTQLERDGLAERHEGADRRRVEVRLTTKGRRRARAARTARDEVIAGATSGLTTDEGQILESLLDKLVSAQVVGRVERRRAGQSGAWWCRTCDFAACGRHEGRCPAQVTAKQTFTQ